MAELNILEELQRDGEVIIYRLDRWARETGDKVFFMYGEDNVRLTYAEFGHLTDAIAGNLARLGIGKGDRVSLFMRNQLVSALCMFGIWKAGAVYCPINFGFTGRLLSYQIGDTRPKLLITERGMVPVLNDIADDLAAIGQAVVYDAPENAHDHVANPASLTAGVTELSWKELTELKGAAARPDVTLEWDDVASIVYTSGTTGPSKGVLQTHRWINQYTFLLRKMLNQDDVVYNDLPLYHVGGAFANVVRACWPGAAVACWDRFSPTQFWSRIAWSKATAAILLDTMIPWLANVEPRADDRDNTLNKVHMQPLPKHHAEVARRFGFDYVTAGFGQTESGLGCAAIIEETDASTCTPPQFRRGLTHDEMRALAARYDVPFVKPESASRKGYMGKPFIFIEATVLDERDCACPPGEVGQLAFRPRLPALMLLEYLGKPEATVKAFRNLWFHTGDAARREEDGTFTFIDRMGDRIRVRGENISSYHVEDIVNQCPGVSVSAAFPIPASEGDEDEVVVFVVPREGETLSEQTITEWAARQMPKFMRPCHVRIVADLPRTLTQKVEKYKLRTTILQELQAADVSA